MPEFPVEVPGTLSKVPLELLCYWMYGVKHEFKAHFHLDIQQTMPNQFLNYVAIIIGLFA